MTYLFGLGYTVKQKFCSVCKRLLPEGARLNKCKKCLRKGR